MAEEKIPKLNKHNYLLEREFLEDSEDIRKEYNTIMFLADYQKGKLDKNLGDFVAYIGGKIGGASKKGEDLYKEASCTYGKSKVSVFKVPVEEEGIESIVSEGMNIGLSNNEKDILVNLYFNPLRINP